MLYILWGQDDFSLDEALNKIKRSIGDQTALATNTTILEGQQLTKDQLRSVCETAPFLSKKRLVIVNGLMERFEPQTKANRSKRKKTTTAPDRQEESKSLAEYISTIPESTVLVLIDSKLSAQNPLFKQLADKAEVKSFPPMKGKKLQQWIESKVTKEGGSISPQAIALMAELVGSDLWIMSNEIIKLSLFTEGRKIEVEDVKAVVSHAQEANVFAMVDAFLESNSKNAELLLNQLIQSGAAPTYLLVMLLRQLHMIVCARELKSQGRTDIEIGEKLRITNDFALRKTLEQTRKFSIEKLRYIYHKLLETDLAIKTGKFSGELALNILIAELCQ